MPRREVHFDNCYKKLGAGWGKVHKWLDKHAGLTYPLTAHRCINHHLKGIEEVRKMWGDEAAEAAKIHIEDDLDWAGYNIKYIPKDREDAKRFYGNIDEYLKRG